MQEAAKRFIPHMYTEQQLVDFGNYLLKTYGVQVYSNEGQNVPLYQREVSGADMSNWMAGQIAGNSSGCILPSQFQIGDKASLKLTGLSSKGDGALATVDCIAEILTVHFYEGKVKYDLELPLEFGSTRVYNIDSVFVSPA